MEAMTTESELLSLEERVQNIGTRFYRVLYFLGLDGDTDNPSSPD